MMKTLTAGRVGLPLLSPSPLPQLAATERDLGKSRGEAEARAAEAVRMDNIRISLSAAGNRSWLRCASPTSIRV